MRNKTLGQLVLSRARGEEATAESVTMDDVKKAIKDRVEIKALLEAASENPLKPLTYLKEAGLDLSSITQGLKSVTEVYRDLAIQEREAKQQAEQDAREARSAVEQTQTQVLQLLITNFLQQQQQQISELMQKLERVFERQQTREPDPLTKNLQEGLAAILTTQLQSALAPESRRSRLEELVDDLKVVSALMDLLKVRREPEVPIKTDNERLALEVMKLQLEDEREREKIRREQELEERKLHAIEKGASILKENLGDILRALAETSATVRQKRAAAPPRIIQPVRRSQQESQAVT